MAMNEEMLKVIRYIDSTGHGTTTAVQELWNEITLTAAERDELVYEAFAVRVNETLRSFSRRKLLEQSVSPQILVGVKVINRERSVIELNVDILSRVSYDICGERRKVIDLSSEDAEYLIERGEAAIRGQQQHVEFYRYVRDRLEETGAETVSGLGAQRQEKIAAMLKALEIHGRPVRAKLVPNIVHSQIDSNPVLTT